MKRRMFLAGGAVLGTASGGLAAPARAAGAREWRLLSFWPKAHPVTGHLGRYATMIESATDGALRLVIEPAAGKPPNTMISRVGAGDYDLGHAVPYLWTNTIPAASLLFTYPFGPTRREKNAWLTHGGGQDLVDRVYASAGCKFFALGGSGPQMGGWYKSPLRSVDDLTGLRIRIGGLGAQVMEAAGAQPKAIPVFGGRIQAALADGTIDAAEVQTPSADLRNGFHELAGTYHYPNWHEPSPTFDLFINSERWGELDEGMREIVRLVTRVVDEEMRDATVAGNAKAFAGISDMSSVLVAPFPPDVMARLSGLAPEILRASTESDPQSAELYASLDTFLRLTNPWSQVTDGAYLAARG